jgi:hypothetical protein
MMDAVVLMGMDSAAVGTMVMVTGEVTMDIETEDTEETEETEAKVDMVETKQNRELTSPLNPEGGLPEDRKIISIVQGL